MSIKNYQEEKEREEKENELNIKIMAVKLQILESMLKMLQRM